MTAAEADRVLQAVEDDLDAVEAALARVDDDRYGLCSRCGLPIPPEVMAADPLADRCLAPCVG